MMLTTEFSPQCAGFEQRLSRPAPLAWLGLALTLMLCGCLDGGLFSRDSATQAQRAATQGRHAEAARHYEELAADATGVERDAYLLDASRAWFRAGQGQRALDTLDRVAGALPANDAIVTMLLAEKAMRRNSPDEALGLLEPLVGRVSQSLAPALYDLRGRAYLMRGDAVGVATALSERELWLDDTQSIRSNQKRLLRALTELAHKGHSLAVPDNASRVVAGWLRLARVQAGAQDPYAARETIAAWRAQFPDHPAISLADELFGPALANLEFPRSVAVILPQNGRLAGAAAAIRDGFVSAYLQDADNLNRPQLNFFDVAERGAAQAYNDALMQGSEFVVGPLSQRSVIEIAALRGQRVTTLALNYLPAETPSPVGFYQFALAPEHEAAEIARRAVRDGLTRAVALVPDSDWGTRLLESFQRALADSGGVLLEYGVYDPNARDFGTPIKQLLLLDQSRQRYRNVAAAIGKNLEFEPRRRQDVEFVFVAANAKQMRLLKPQLRYHYAEDLPVHANASAYDFDPAANSEDLEGLVVADMPWMFGPSGQAANAKALIERYWPEQIRRRGRLYAMGYDAYSLIALLHGQERALDPPWPGVTGLLKMGVNGRIERTLEIGEIRGGEAQRIVPIDEQLDEEISRTDPAAQSVAPAAP